MFNSYLIQRMSERHTREPSVRGEIRFIYTLLFEEELNECYRWEYNKTDSVKHRRYTVSYRHE